MGNNGIQNNEEMESVQSNLKMVRIGNPGPNGKIGLLLGINENFLTLYTEKDGVIYYNMNHVKQYTEFAKEGLHSVINFPKGLNYVEEFSYDSLAETDEWVVIHLGGPEKVEGIVKSVSENFIKLIFHEEIIHVAKYHIKSIQLGKKPTEQMSENAVSQNEEQNQQDGIQQKDSNEAMDKKEDEGKEKKEAQGREEGGDKEKKDNHEKKGKKQEKKAKRGDKDNKDDKGKKDSKGKKK